MWASVRVLLLMTCLVLPLGSLHVLISLGGFLTDIIPTLRSDSTRPSPDSLQVLEPWASLFGAAVSSAVPPSSQPLGLLLFPSKYPWNPLTLVNRYFPSGGPLLRCLRPGSSDQRCSPSSLPRLERSFQKTTLCMPPPTQRSPITA